MVSVQFTLAALGTGVLQTFSSPSTVVLFSPRQETPGYLHIVPYDATSRPLSCHDILLNGNK